MALWATIIMRHGAVHGHRHTRLRWSSRWSAATWHAYRDAVDAAALPARAL
jgi:hypothetical protein